MAYIGLLALGFFVGTFLAYGLGQIKNVADWTKVVATIGSIALGAVVTVFLDKYAPSVGVAIFMYLYGLGLSIPWLHVGDAVALATDTSPSKRIWGSAALFGMALGTLFAFALAIPPAVVEVWPWLSKSR